jgi:hypothetical protein
MVSIVARSLKQGITTVRQRSSAIDDKVAVCPNQEDQWPPAANAHGMRRLAIATIACALLLLPAAAHAAEGDPPCPDGEAPDPSGLVCVLVNHVTTGVEVVTQPPAAQDPWLTNALELKHRLGDALPLRDAMWVGTHNSFNTASNTPPSLSNTDGNQRLSLVDQLSVGVRGIEIDIHWMPSVWANGANAVVVCHGLDESQFNVGCTDERLLADELAPVGEWVRAHPGDVILVYVEDDLTTDEGFAEAASAIDDTIGDLVYLPPAPAPGEICPLLPLSLHRADVLAAGKQVVVMSGCSTGSAATGNWTSTVFDDSVRAEECNPEFAGYPDCSSPGVPASAYGENLVRFYEDSTFVSTAAAGGDPGQRMTVDGIRDMVRCGVNLFGLDQLVPSDPRLDAMVWSWAANEPAIGASCAIDDGRFRAAACKGKHPYACVARSSWFVTAAAGPQDRGARACAREFPGSTFAVPGSGAHAEALRAVERGPVWLAYTNPGDGWRGAAA